MIVCTRAPLRISLAGGGSDLPWFTAAGEEADVLTTAIDRFVHVMIGPRFDGGLRVAYSKNETVERAEQLEHPILRIALAGLSGLEIHATADVASGTGLGSSGAFTVAVLAALRRWAAGPPSALRPVCVDRLALARDAFRLEAQVDPNNGWQDHAIASLGGTCRFTAKRGVEDLEAKQLHEDELRGLGSLSLWYTGKRRSASSVLADQSTTRNVDAMRKIRHLVPYALEHGIGAAFAEHWKLKRATAASMTDAEIDEHVRAAYAAGADGVKVVGAGGGGFLLVSTERDAELGDALTRRGLVRLPFRPGANGVEVMTWGAS